MMGYTSKNLSLSLLALLAALTASPPPWVSAATTVVHTQQDLIAALRNESVQVAQLAGNLRLEPELFGTGLLQRQSDFVVLGGQDYPIFDFSFIEYKIYLAPGVRFTLEQVGRQGRCNVRHSAAPHKKAKRARGRSQGAHWATSSLWGHEDCRARA